MNIGMKDCQLLVNLRTWYPCRKHPDRAAKVRLGKGYIAQALCISLLGIKLKRMNGMWIGDILKCYHYISLLRFRILKMAKHFLHCLHDPTTWLSGKLWAVKWMFHDTTQMTCISCLIHNIPLSVQDKNLESHINLSHQILYWWRATLLHTFGVILMAETPRQSCLTFTLQKQDLDFFCGEKNTVP